MKANGGVFLVDDFGRQRIRPQDLLNRWIVPLESRMDYLTLHTGKKFQVPFDVADRLRHESRSRVACRRSVPAPDSLQDPDRRSHGRAVHAHLRAQLPAAQFAVSPGDGRVPAAPALRAVQAAVARVPSARSARPDHGALPLPREAADDHARAARRRLCRVFRETSRRWRRRRVNTPGRNWKSDDANALARQGR